jgi:hypothetical protein
MAKDLDPRNKNNSLQRAQAGSTVVKELRSASSGFRRTPESRPSAAAVEAEKHTPKVAGKKNNLGIKYKATERNHLIRPSNCQMLTMKNFKTNCAPQRRRLCPKISQLQTLIQDILIFSKSS